MVGHYECLRDAFHDVVFAHFSVVADPANNVSVIGHDAVHLSDVAPTITNLLAISIAIATARHRAVSFLPNRVVPTITNRLAASIAIATARHRAVSFLPNRARARARERSPTGSEGSNGERRDGSPL